jgi:hypothetical protein
MVVALTDAGVRRVGGGTCVLKALLFSVNFLTQGASVQVL